MGDGRRFWVKICTTWIGIVSLAEPGHGAVIEMTMGHANIERPEAEAWSTQNHLIHCL